MSPAEEAELIAWILREATARSDPEALIGGLCRRLCAAGMPLWRFSVGVPVIDPIVRGISVTWIEGQPLRFDPTEHEGGEAIFQRSPLSTLLSEQRAFGRWSLRTVADLDRYPLLVDLHASGGTDYAVLWRKRQRRRSRSTPI